MRLISVETTPNPNSMKLNLDHSFGITASYSRMQHEGCPQSIAPLLSIAGLHSVFVCSDFVTLNKDPRVDWRPILETATRLLSDRSAIGTSRPSPLPESSSISDDGGLTQVLVQTFKGIPIQIKVVDGHGESRISLGAKFNEAAQFIQETTGADFLATRYWADYGHRDGARELVASEVLEEITAAFNDDAIERLKLEAVKGPFVSGGAAEAGLSAGIASLMALLKDSDPKLRRQAAASLGATGDSAAVPGLCEALLNDSSVAVRRTAGDALSDIGDVTAQPSICLALGDCNKLVRWRAARFLSDHGNVDALPYLHEAANDGAFEVRLEIKAAVERIEGGAQGNGPAWRRITESC